MKRELTNAMTGRKMAGGLRKKAHLAIAAALIAISLMGCGASGEEGTKAEAAKAESSSAAPSEEAESYRIGIGQFAEHGSLDNCREGFLLGLAEEGIVEGENLTVEYDNANADGSISNQIMQSYVGADMDLICAIATPIAQ